MYSRVQNNREKKALNFLRFFLILFISDSVNKGFHSAGTVRVKQFKNCHPVYFLVKQLLNSTYLLHGAESFLRS